MPPNNRTVSRQNSPSGQHNAAESMTSEADGVQLPANVDRYMQTRFALVINTMGIMQTRL